jgi:sugar-specific transcriptional regulator TrmB
VPLDLFGFTETETRVFEALATLGAATGYAVAKSTGIARANTYQALEVLVRANLVTADRAKPVVYRARSGEAVLEALERNFRRDLSRLEKRMAEIRQVAEGPEAAEVVSLGGADDLLAAASHLAAEARRELLGVVGAWARALYPELERAAQRGVGCRLLSLSRPGPHGAAVREVAARDLESYWGGAPLLLVADSRRAVCGIKSQGGEATGMATTHPGLVPFLRHLLRRELASGPAGA